MCPDKDDWGLNVHHSPIAPCFMSSYCLPVAILTLPVAVVKPILHKCNFTWLPFGDLLPAFSLTLLVGSQQLKITNGNHVTIECCSVII